MHLYIVIPTALQGKVGFNIPFFHNSFDKASVFRIHRRFLFNTILGPGRIYRIWELVSS